MRALSISENMNIDELARITPAKDAQLSADFERWIKDWKLSDATIDDLDGLVSKQCH